MLQTVVRFELLKGARVLEENRASGAKLRFVRQVRAGWNTVQSRRTQ